MKYIMYETADGQHIPVLFPDCLTHAIMDTAFRVSLMNSLNLNLKYIPVAVGAGFVKLEKEWFVTYGSSESMGLSSRSVDGDYMSVGDTAAFMPEFTMKALASQIKAKLQTS